MSAQTPQVIEIPEPGLDKSAFGGLVLFGVLGIIVVVAVIMIGGGINVGSAEDTRAQRITAAGVAEAARIRAQGEADATRTLALAQAADARHDRMMDLLPVLAITGGTLIIIALAILAAWDLRAQRRALTPVSSPPPPVMVYMVTAPHQPPPAITRQAAQDLVHLPREKRVVVYRDGWE